jgi:hypothetical protein
VGKTSLPKGRNPDYKPGPPWWALSTGPTTLSRKKHVLRNLMMKRKLRPTPGCDAKEEEEESSYISMC